jgi:micrococcal nuclease
LVTCRQLLFYGILLLPSDNQAESEVITVMGKLLFPSLLLILLLASPCLSWAWSGEVVGITDEDTITILNSKTLKDVKIRLYGIDCPEGGQAFSKRARQFTSKTVYGKVVEVKVMATVRYGRTVAMIFADKTLLNEELVKAGLAWVYEFHCSEPICESWENFQLRARFDKRGLWADPHAIPPWEFRRENRKGGK